MCLPLRVRHSIPMVLICPKSRWYVNAPILYQGTDIESAVAESAIKSWYHPVGSVYLAIGPKVPARRGNAVDANHHLEGLRKACSSSRSKSNSSLLSSSIFSEVSLIGLSSPGSFMFSLPPCAMFLKTIDISASASSCNLTWVSRDSKKEIYT